MINTKQQYLKPSNNEQTNDFRLVLKLPPPYIYIYIYIYTNTYRVRSNLPRFHLTRELSWWSETWEIFFFLNHSSSHLLNDPHLLFPVQSARAVEYTVCNLWYYVCHGTECEKWNIIAPSRTLINIALLQRQGDLAIPNTKLLFSCHLNTRQTDRQTERERERELARVYEQRHRTPSVDVPRGSVTDSTRLDSQLNWRYLNIATDKFSNPLIFMWLVGWVLWPINLCRLFNAKSIFMQIITFI